MSPRRRQPDTIDALRAAGFLPVGEKADGTIACQQAGAAPGRRHPHDRDVDRAAPGAGSDDTTKTLPSGNRAARPLKTPNPPASAAQLVDTTSTSEDLIEVIDEAMEAESPVAFGYRDAKGEERIVVGYPNWVSEYELDATTERGPQTFLLDRIEWAERVDLLGDE